MAVYDLDVNEQIDIIKINWRDYEIWDIPIYILEKVNKIKWWFFRKEKIEDWIPIFTEILEIRNDNVDLKKLTSKKLSQLILIIKNKIVKWNIW
jgi:hypothetical protein